MTTPLEDIRFLADSDNRFTALEALAIGPHTEAPLQSETAASKATISRLLGDFEDHGWVTRTGTHYELTPVARMLDIERESDATGRSRIDCRRLASTRDTRLSPEPPSAGYSIAHPDRRNHPRNTGPGKVGHRTYTLRV